MVTFLFKNKKQKNNVREYNLYVNLYLYMSLTKISVWYSKNVQICVPFFPHSGLYSYKHIKHEDV